MAVKTLFTDEDFVPILDQYDLGVFREAHGVESGTVQTNYILRTSRGRFVFRLYENRTFESVLFERDLIEYLVDHRFPCPEVIANRQGRVVGSARNKPYMIFAFCLGEHVTCPDDEQWRELIQKAAELHLLTAGFRSPYTAYRWNYSPELCRRLAMAEAQRIDTADAHAKYAWLCEQLDLLRLPDQLCTGICHGDFHFSNVLYQGDRFAALLDFDDANQTFLLFDLVGLIEYRAWPFLAETPDMSAARTIVDTYGQYRSLTSVERRHTYDVYILSILFDCVWYFERGSADDFYERRKVEALRRMGRERFAAELYRE